MFAVETVHAENIALADRAYRFAMELAESDDNRISGEVYESAKSVALSVIGVAYPEWNATRVYEWTVENGHAPSDTVSQLQGKYREHVSGSATHQIFPVSYKFDADLIVVVDSYSVAVINTLGDYEVCTVDADHYIHAAAIAREFTLSLEGVRRSGHVPVRVLLDNARVSVTDPVLL